MEKNQESKYFNEYNIKLDEMHNKYLEHGGRRRVLNSLMEFSYVANDGQLVLDVGGDEIHNEEYHINFKELFTTCHNLDYHYINQDSCDARYDTFPYVDNKFDIVMSHECIEHLWNFREDGMMDYDGILHFWKESYRVLKPGGTFLISTRNRNCPMAFSRLKRGYPLMVSICSLEMDLGSHAQELAASDFVAIVDKTKLFEDYEMYSIPSHHFPYQDAFRKKMEDFWERELEDHELYDTLFFKGTK